MVRWKIKIIFCGVFLSSLVHSALIDPAIMAFDTPKIEIVALLSPNCLDATDSIQRLKELNQKCAQEVAQFIGLTREFRPLWISHAVAMDLTKDQITKLAQHPMVIKIYLNRNLKFETTGPKKVSKTLYPYSFDVIRLTSVIKKNLSLTGKNQIIGLIDTGVDASHQLLKGKILKFFDAEKNQLTTPFDLSNHGTHVAGILVGGSRQGPHLGVAPEAKLIVAKIANIESAIKAMQFMAEQSGVRVVNNSWGQSDLPDVEIYYRALGLWESLGIIPVFSAGNSGPSRHSIGHPKEHPSTIVVGASLKDGQVAPLSSRGPTLFRNNWINKPDLIAPGEKIISTLPGNRLGEWSGTSMAAPLVTGTIALMLQKKPSLSNSEIRQILIQSAQGFSSKWHPARGYGLLNVEKALELTEDSRQGRFKISSFFWWPNSQLEAEFENVSTPQGHGVFEFPELHQGTTWIQMPAATNNR